MPVTVSTAMQFNHSAQSRNSRKIKRFDFDRACSSYATDDFIEYSISQYNIEFEFNYCSSNHFPSENLGKLESTAAAYGDAGWRSCSTAYTCGSPIVQSISDDRSFDVTCHLGYSTGRNWPTTDHPIEYYESTATNTTGDQGDHHTGW